jgi:hypothetical protein
VCPHLTTPGGPAVTQRVRLGEVLLTLEGDLLTVVAPQWEPGIFFKHVERLESEVTEGRSGLVLTVGTGGGPVPWEVLRLPVPPEREDDVRAFLAAAEAARAASSRH